MFWSPPSVAQRRIAIFVGLLAFAVRLYWNLKVQHPLDAVYSDQAGYYERACDLLDGRTRGDLRMYAFAPWGAHAVTAVELFVAGRKSIVGIAIFHALATTIPAVCTVSFVARVVRSRAWLIVAGVTAALWQPAITHGAFFMSENWYGAALTLGTVFFLRFLEGKREPLRAGACFAVAITVRPQLLLTFAIAGAALLAIAYLRPARAPFRGRTKLRHWVLFFAPVVLILGVSAVHMKETAGHWGLVSENGPINRVWAATHIGRLEARWVGTDGQHYSAWYAPSPKFPAQPPDIVSVEGHVGDAEVMNRLRVEHEKLETPTQRLRRTFWNVRLLAYQYAYPEQAYANDPVKAPVRTWLQRTFRRLVITILPLALLGWITMFFSKRGYLTGVIIGAHAITSIVAAALYLGEGRMRIPYDAFLITAATAGLAFLVSQAAQAYRRYA